MRTLFRVVAAWLLITSMLAAHAENKRTWQPWMEGATPPLQLPDLAGKPHNLTEYKGNVVLVNFWASWCVPCRAEMPTLAALHKRLAKRGLVVLAVNVGESPERSREFLATIPNQFETLLDRDSASLQPWQLRGLPASYLIDRHGAIRYIAVGELDFASPHAAQTVENLLSP